MKTKLLAIAAASIMLQACVSAPSYVQLTEQKRNLITHSELHSLVPQDEVKPVVNLSSASLALGGGLIPAMIDSSIDDSRSLTARDLIKPLYDEVVDVDFRQLLAGEVNPVLTSKISLHNPKASADVELLTDKEVKAKITALEDGEAFVHMHTVYQFRDEFKTLQTRSQVFLFMKPQGKVSLSAPDYHNVYTYQSDLVGQGGASSIKEWAKNDAQLFKSELQKSVVALANMMDYDLTRPLVEDCLGFAKTEIELDLSSLKFDGQIINRANGTSLVRDKKGELVMMPSGRFKTNDKKVCEGA